MRYLHRVIFGDTDQMGIVYYANYYRFFEAARAEYLRALGKSYRDLVAMDVALPVVESHCNYKRPAHFEDVLAIDTHISKLRGASLTFSYEVRRDEVLLATGHTTHACIGSNGRPKALPPVFAELLRACVADVQVM
ncbi:MAG: acyl-CoA thioesterase [Myxococcales bacterium]|nr:acyl-CoA thioesterase [Myxococcales bacterium]